MAGRRKAARAVNWVRSRAVKNFLGLNSLEAHLWPANPKYRAIMRGGKTVGYLRRKLTEKVALDRLDRMLKYEVEYGLETRT